MSRTTMKQLSNIVERLNMATNNPTVPYASVCDGTGKRKYTAQVGNYNIDQSYGGFQLCQITNDGGGVRNVMPMRGTKTDCWNAISTVLKVVGE